VARAFGHDEIGRGDHPRLEVIKERRRGGEGGGGNGEGKQGRMEGKKKVGKQGRRIGRIEREEG
jgi:hypothetical protein